MGRAKFKEDNDSKLGFFVGKSSNMSAISKEKEEKKSSAKKKNENANHLSDNKKFITVKKKTFVNQSGI